MIVKKELFEITADKILFDKLLKLSTKPVKVSERIKASHPDDDYSDKQTRLRKSEDILDLQNDKSR